MVQIPMVQTRMVQTRMVQMTQRYLVLLLLAAAGLVGLGLFSAGEARAHPHVWVTIKSEVIFAADGKATAVRHRWTFDEMFSVFATQGMDSNKAGGLTKEDLASLAEVNISSLKDFDFFTFAKVGGAAAVFDPPRDYWLEMKNGALTLHFTLPFRKPVDPKKLEFEVYDASFFVDFMLGKGNPVTLVGAPGTCKVSAQSSRDSGAPPQISESFFDSLGSASNFGAQFANRVSVTCP